MLVANPIIARTVSRATLVFKEHASLRSLSRPPASRPAVNPARSPRLACFEPRHLSVSALVAHFVAVALALLGGEILVAGGRTSMPCLGFSAQLLASHHKPLRSRDLEPSPLTASSPHKALGGHREG